MEHALFHGDIVSTRRTIYTPTSFARSSLIYLQEIGSLKANREHTSKRDNLNSFLFFFIHEGTGVISYKGASYQLKKGDCIFINCSDGYSHTTSENLWNISWIHFNGPLMLNIYEKYKQRGGQPVFHPESVELFQSIWEQVYNIANSTDYLRDMRINQHLNELLSEIMVFSWSEKKHSEKKIYEVKQYIEENYVSRITLEDLAKRFYINKYYLLRLFKGQYGMTVNEYIQQLRISRAKNLLRFSSKSIREISCLCGFEDSHYFSRVFMKVEGISPSGYRENW